MFSVRSSSLLSLDVCLCLRGLSWWNVDELGNEHDCLSSMKEAPNSVRPTITKERRSSAIVSCSLFQEEIEFPPLFQVDPSNHPGNGFLMWNNDRDEVILQSQHFLSWLLWASWWSWISHPKTRPLDFQPRLGVHSVTCLSIPWSCLMSQLLDCLPNSDDQSEVRQALKMHLERNQVGDHVNGTHPGFESDNGPWQITSANTKHGKTRFWRWKRGYFFVFLPLERTLFGLEGKERCFYGFFIWDVDDAWVKWQMQGDTAFCQQLR